MFESNETDLSRRWTQEDIIAKGLRTALSACLPAGGIIAEFLTEFIPGQRLDRLHDFVGQLNERIRDVEEEFKTRLRTSPYAALAEQAAIAAVRSSSAQRRADLAEILRSGLSLEDAEVVGHEALLRLLDDLNDAEILILMAYGCFSRTYGDPELASFYNEHPGLFSVEPPTMGSDADIRRRWTMRQHYESHLESRGLLKDTEGMAKSSAHYPSFTITPLGAILLRAIGRTTHPHAG